MHARSRLQLCFRWRRELCDSAQLTSQLKKRKGTLRQATSLHGVTLARFFLGCGPRPELNQIRVIWLGAGFPRLPGGISKSDPLKADPVRLQQHMQACRAVMVFVGAGVAEVTACAMVSWALLRCRQRKSTCAVVILAQLLL